MQPDIHLFPRTDTQRCRACAPRGCNVSPKMMVAVLVLPCLCLADSLTTIAGRVTLQGDSARQRIELELFSEGKGKRVKDDGIATILATLEDRFGDHIVGPTDKGAGVERFYTIRDADHTDYYQLEATVEIETLDKLSLDDVVGFFGSLLDNEPIVRIRHGYTGPWPGASGVRVDVSQFATLTELNRRFNAFGERDTLIACLKRFCEQNELSLYKVDNIKTRLLAALTLLDGTLVLTEDVEAGFVRWYVVRQTSYSGGSAKLLLSGLGPVSVSEGEMLLNQRYWRPSPGFHVPNGRWRYMRRALAEIRFSRLYLCLSGELTAEEVVSRVERNMDRLKVDIGERCPRILKL